MNLETLQEKWKSDCQIDTDQYGNAQTEIIDGTSGSGTITTGTKVFKTVSATFADTSKKLF